MPRSDEEVWRLPATVRGQDARLGKGGGASRPPPLSAEGKARLQRIVNRAPEVVLKVTGRTRGGAAHLKAHLDYITRNGRIVAETQDGVRIQDRAELRALHDEWLFVNKMHARRKGSAHGAHSVGLILSMPPGAPRDRVQEAARSWALETFNGTYDWVMVRHDDRDHPHVHVTVRAVGYDGKRLAPGPDDLQAWRERFARNLRRLGVEAEATPRQARGMVPRSDRAPVVQAERRGGTPRVRDRERGDAKRAASTKPPPPPRDWHKDIQARQASIRRAYLHHAAELAQGDAADRRLARDIERFVADMPVPLTRIQALATELRHVLAQHPSRTPQPHGMPNPPDAGSRVPDRDRTPAPQTPPRPGTGRRR